MIASIHFRHPIRAVFAAGLVVATAFAGAKTAPPKMEHNAFLRKPVFDAKGLVEQIQSDPVVRRRYEAHFPGGAPTILRYLKTLKLQPLSETRRYLVYNVDGAMVVRNRNLLMRKGTLVFVDKKGKPILKRSCGNPMIAYLPPVGVATLGSKDPEPTLEGLAEDKNVANEPELAFEPEPSASAMPEPAPEPILEQVTPDPIPSPASFPLPPVVPAAAFPGWVIAIPGLIGGAALIGGGGGGGNTPPPVPEPATIAVLAIGAGALARRRFKRRD